MEEQDLRAPLSLLDGLEKIEAAIFLCDEDDAEKIGAAKRAAYEWLCNGKEGLEVLVRVVEG